MPSSEAFVTHDMHTVLLRPEYAHMKSNYQLELSTKWENKITSFYILF